MYCAVIRMGPVLVFTRVWSQKDKQSTWFPHCPLLSVSLRHLQQAAAYRKASLSSPRWGHHFCQLITWPPPSCPVLQKLTGRFRQWKWSPSPLSILKFIPCCSHGNQPRLSNRLLEQILCISCVVQYFIYFVFLFLYIIFLQIVWFPWMSVWASLPLGSWCDIILFKMHLFLLSILFYLKQKVPFSDSSWKFMSLFSWELTDNKGTKQMLHYNMQGSWWFNEWIHVKCIMNACCSPLRNES